MCPGSGGVCPDGGNGPGITPDGSMGPGMGMCPGSGGICPDGGMSPNDGGMSPNPMGADGSTNLDASDIRARFFSAGPTNIFSILAEIDGRIGEINQRSNNQNVPCLSQAPVPYTISALGQSVPFYAQCVSRVSTPTPSTRSFFQFGRNGGVVYLYEAIGAAAIAARVTPSTSGLGQPVVEAWMGVGYENAASCGNANGFDDCSYGVMALKADADRAHFELTVAGIGFGYCGAQLRSDGHAVFVEGSPDMGATCAPAASVCVSAADVTMTATCPSASFELPAIGRGATSGPNGMWGATQYGSGSIHLDGTASDSLAFGPSSPTPGAADFAAVPTDDGGGSAPPEGGARVLPGDASAE